MCMLSSVQIVHDSCMLCGRATEHKDDQPSYSWPLTVVWPLRELNALLMRALNGECIDQSVYRVYNCIILQPKDREPNKHRRLTPQIRLLFFVTAQHKRITPLKSLTLPGRSEAADLATNAHKSRNFFSV